MKKLSNTPSKNDPFEEWVIMLVSGAMAIIYGIVYDRPVVIAIVVFAWVGEFLWQRKKTRSRSRDGDADA